MTAKKKELDPTIVYISNLPEEYTGKKSLNMFAPFGYICNNFY